MNRYLQRVLRAHLSKGQLLGFFFANLVGMTIVLLGIQIYNDLAPALSGEDGLLKQDYIVVTKKVSTLGSLVGSKTSFSESDIEDLKKQPFTQTVGTFTTTQCSVFAGMGMEGTNLQMTTELFFESVPDRFLDLRPSQWTFDSNDNFIPIIIPRTYLHLYNFGFAQARNLPKISEGVTSLLRMDIVLRGNGQTKRMKGGVVGYTDRLNTILVPQSFMDWANATFAPNKKIEPSRLIVEVKNPADADIATYFKKKGYETEDNKLAAGKTTYFLRMVVGIVLVIGLLISVLSVYIFMLSIYLLLQKNTVKLESLLLLGFSPRQVAAPYQWLTIGLNALVQIMAWGIIYFARKAYLDLAGTVLPTLKAGSFWPAIGIGIVLFVVVSTLNNWAIRRKISQLHGY